MRTKFVINQKNQSYEKQWILSRWFEKSYYVIGFVFTWLWLVALGAGIVAGILDEII
jgi:hypothetical protein